MYGRTFNTATGVVRCRTDTFLYVVPYVNKYFEFKKLVGRWGAPELELLAVVIVLFAPIIHETLTNSNFNTNTICQLAIGHGSLFDCRELESISQQNALLTALLLADLPRHTH